jgi:hypothetical protein
VLLTGTLGALELQTDYLQVSADSGKLLSSKFPAISQEALDAADPVLTDPDDGDTINYYRPFDEDTVGKDFEY